VISQSHRPLPDNTQHSQQTDIHRTPLDEWSARRRDLYLTTHKNSQQTDIHRTPLYKWSVRRRDLYLTTHNTHNKHRSKPSVGFEPKVSADERPQTHALVRAVTGTGSLIWFGNTKPCHQVTRVQAPQRDMTWTSVESPKMATAKRRRWRRMMDI